MNATSTEALERVKVREVVGVFRTLQEFDATTSALLRAGFDRADIDVIGGCRGGHTETGCSWDIGDRTGGRAGSDAASLDTA